MSKSTSLKRPRQPMPSFVRSALIDSNLMEAYKLRPPYQRNDYLMWINAAKREDTKKRRLFQMLEELEDGHLYMKMKWSPRVSEKQKTSNAKTSKKKKAKILSSGNPQIAKGFGNEAVQEYIAAMPGWKKGVGELLDQLIAKAVPQVEKAVKWNTPLYGMPDNGYFMAMYCYKKYVQVTFFAGESQKPVPPVESKQKGVRYLNIYEDEKPSEAQMKKWIKQASKLPGEEL